MTRRQRWGLMRWPVVLAHPEFFVITIVLLYAAGACASGDRNSDQIICAVKAYSLTTVVGLF